MIKTLYPCFRRWSEKGSVYIISDTHFDDSDCRLMDPAWISPEEHVNLIREYVHKNDTLIHLGDVGNPEWIKKIPGYKVLVMGNHDPGASVFETYFEEVFTGPVMIAEKLLLSHEPVQGVPWVYNIHGHDHNKENKGDLLHLNCASNVCGYVPVNLKDIIRNGAMKNVPSLHRIAIDAQIASPIRKKNTEDLYDA